MKHSLSLPLLLLWWILLLTPTIEAIDNNFSEKQINWISNPNRILSFPKRKLSSSSSSSSIKKPHRKIQSIACPFESLLDGVCELKEFCQGLGDQITCYGNVTKHWTIQYNYNDELCHPASTQQQLCLKEYGALHFFHNSLLKVQNHETYTQPVPGAILWETSIRRCQSEEEPDFTFGESFHFCEESCPSVSIGGIECSRSCTTCTDGSTVIDCSMVHESLTPSCSIEKDFYRDVFQYWKMSSSSSSAALINHTCTYDALISNQCTLDEYCQTLPTEPASSIRCTGLTSSAWQVAIEYDEYCYSNYTDPLGHVMSKNNNQDSHDQFTFCSTQETIFRFIGHDMVEIDATETFTYPIQGTIQQVNMVQRCDTRPDHFLGPGHAFCEQSCPIVSRIGGTVCDQECRTCPDGSTVITCSDIGIEEPCEMENPFYASVLHFFNSSLTRTNDMNNIASDLESTFDTANASSSTNPLFHQQVWMTSLSMLLYMFLIQ